MGFREIFGLDHFVEDFFGGYKNRKERERREARLIGQQATILAIVAQKQKDADAKVARQRAKGHDVRDIIWEHGEVLGWPALFKFFENNDPSRCDIYYGGQGAPDGRHHGHVIVRNGQVINWWSNDGDREKRTKLI